jgi:hypothetical protein
LRYPFQNFCTSIAHDRAPFAYKQLITIYYRQHSFERAYHLKVQRVVKIDGMQALLARGKSKACIASQITQFLGLPKPQSSEIV